MNRPGDNPVITFTTIEAKLEGWRAVRNVFELAIVEHAKSLAIGQAFDITLSEDVDKAVGRLSNVLRKGPKRFAFRRRSVTPVSTVYRIHRVG